MDLCLFPKPMTLSFSPRWYRILERLRRLPQTFPFMLARAQPSLIFSIHVNPSENHKAPPTAMLCAPMCDCISYNVEGKQ